jgi:CRP-like cAMP-binding protein
MTERKCAAGEMLFYKDEKADSMFYIVSGRFQLAGRAQAHHRGDQGAGARRSATARRRRESGDP